MITASVVTFHTPLDEIKAIIQMAESSSIEKLYVVDNASDTGMTSTCRNHDIVEYIASENVGYGAAHNKAMRRAVNANSRYHLIMNTDIEVQPSDIAALTSYMDSHPDVSAIQPRIVNPDGTLQYTVRQLPTPLDVFGRRFLPGALIKKRNDRYLLKHIDHTRPFNVPYHQGSFMFLRTSKAIEIGGFDERFFMYPEDIDLTRRLHRHGLTLYLPCVTVVHRHRAASYTSMRMLAIHCVNMVRYFNKWGWWCDGERRKFNRAIGDCNIS